MKPMNEYFRINKVAVLGAGVMGAQIAAHFANANIEVVLFDLHTDGNEADKIVRDSLAKLKTLKPAPFTLTENTELITPANYNDDLELLRDCELVIEVIAERLDWKVELYEKIVSYISESTILATNTSGISISKMAESLPESLRTRYCGVHFFNPPRYMALVELIPTAHTELHVMDALEVFLVSQLGKGVVRTKDTPNFIGNRIGIFSLLATMFHAERLGLSFDLADALTGSVIGRPRSATYRTMDVIGLDTMVHIINGTAAVIDDDPWKKYYRVPNWLQTLVDNGDLGQKTRSGIYRKDGKTITVLNPEKNEYQAAQAEIDTEIQTILKIKDSKKRFSALYQCDHPQAEFLWAIHRDVFHYAAVLLQQIADNARDVDFAMRWGYGWKQGPFEIWQAAGWKQVSSWIANDISKNKAMVKTTLPEWVNQLDNIHTDQGSWSAIENSYKPYSELAIYKRQIFPEPIAGIKVKSTDETIFENDGVRLWHQNDGIAIASFKTKMNSIDETVLDGLSESISIAEQDYEGLVLWQDKPPFSVGANLEKFLEDGRNNDVQSIDNILIKFQKASLDLKHSNIPVAAAVQGFVLGGGCEFALHCDRIVAALETSIGLVETGVGLIPAGAGTKEMAFRTMENSFSEDELLIKLKHYFQLLVSGVMSTSAADAKKQSLLNKEDILLFNQKELLHVAKSQVSSLANAVYRPRKTTKIKVAGKQGYEYLVSDIKELKEQDKISDHDYLIATRLAEILCGGDVESGVAVEQQIILDLERKLFIELLQDVKTQERIEYMLKTGKRLNN